MDKDNRYYDTPVNRLARAVAKEFGGAIKTNRDGELFEAYAEVSVPADKARPACFVSLSLRGYGAKAQTLTVGLNAIESDSEMSRRYMPDRPVARMDVRRGEAAMLRDIRRRVVDCDGAKAYLIEHAKRLADARRRRGGMASAIERMGREFPNISINQASEPGGYETKFYSSGSGAYFNGRLNGDERVTFDRISPIPWESARRILAILAEIKES